MNKRREEGETNRREKNAKGGKMRVPLPRDGGAGAGCVRVCVVWSSAYTAVRELD